MNQKPFLRGHFHQAAFFIALGACSVLVAMAQGRARAAVLVYGISTIILYGMSALYHRPNWEPRIRAWMRRFDHAAIFVLIAGTVTSIGLLGMDPPHATPLIALIWAAAGVGILKEFVWTKSPKWLTALFYVAVGFLVTPYLGELSAALGTTRVTLVLIGGGVYILGALVYALKWPNILPRSFGYHEVFHLLVIIASILHFIVIYQLVPEVQSL